jgi:hypothetical protein
MIIIETKSVKATGDFRITTERATGKELCQLQYRQLYSLGRLKLVYLLL